MMNNRGLKLSVFLLLAVAMGFISLSNSGADIKADEVLKTSDGNFQFVTYNDADGYGVREFFSLAAMKSYRFLDNAKVNNSDSSSTNMWPGEIISFREGTVTCATQTMGTDKAGECSIIFDNVKHPFASDKVFRNSGFSYERALYLDTSTLQRGSSITLVQQTRRPGTLINDHGTVKLITSSYTTSGVPSVAALNSWGWTLQDVVSATAADKLLLQLNVLPTREPGQIDGLTTSDDDVAESIVMFYLLSKYPNQPRTRALNQDSKAEVLAFHNSIESVKPDQVEPYLSEHSLKLYNTLPSLSSASMTETLVNASYQNAQATILGEGNNAQVKQDIHQPGTNYHTSITIAYKKENNLWKIDLVESLKLEFDNLIDKIPNYTENANADLELVSARVEQSDGMGSNNLIVKIKNHGSSEVLGYGISAYTASRSLIKKEVNTSYYKLKPGQSVEIRIPLLHLEQLGLPSGQYGLTVLLSSTDLPDRNTTNNTINFTSQLNQSFTAISQ